MTTPPLEQLIKLLNMLRSDYPNEVLTAVDKINAVMLSHELTFEHLLANGASAPMTEEQIARVFTEGRLCGNREGYQRAVDDLQAVPGTNHTTSTQVADDLEWLKTMLEAASKAEADQALTAFELEFSTDMRGRLNRFGRATRISQKQHGVLKRLEKSLRRRGYL